MKYDKILWLSIIILLPQIGFATEQIEKEVQKKEKVVQVAAASVLVPTLTLEMAITRALQNSPRMVSAQNSMSAAENALKQAGVYKNPSIGVDVENVAGSGNYKGVNSAELTFGVSQLIEIGGKRDARISVASKDLEIAKFGQITGELDIIQDTTNAYNELVAAQENLALVTEQRSLAKDILKTVTSRVTEAASPLIQKSRAEVEFANSAITLDKAARRYELAKKGLLILTGQNATTDNLDTEKFYAVAEPVEASAENLEQSPDANRLNLSLERSKALAKLEEANSVSDPILNLGVRDLKENDSQAFVLGVSIPLQIFDTNSGNIARAKHEVNQLEADNKQAKLDYQIKLNSAESELRSSYLRAKTLKNEIIKSAEEAFKLAKQGYILGRFSYLDVLDTQRTLFDVETQYIESLKDYHFQKTEIERLTAKQMDKLETPEKKND